MKSNNCIIVDPINPTFLNDAVVKCKYQLRGILSTHHHMFIQCFWMMNRNHVLGMGEMIQKYPEAKVYGGKYEERTI